MAEGRPKFAAGGVLDPAILDAEVYLETPKAAVAPPGRACRVAERYVQLVNAGDYAGVAALYADDATFLEPIRPTLHGRAEIDEFYTKQIGRMRPKLIAVSYVGGEQECMVALALQVQIDGKPRYTLVSVDHFMIDQDGKIGNMTAFARPARGSRQSL